MLRFQNKAEQEKVLIPDEEKGDFALYLSYSYLKFFLMNLSHLFHCSCALAGKLYDNDDGSKMLTYLPYFFLKADKWNAANCIWNDALTREKS